MKKSILLFASLFLAVSSRAGGLKVGDKLPDIQFAQLANGNGTPRTLAGFKGKALILDFWAVWCSTCLAHFPLADSLQREFACQLQVLLVDAANTGDKKERVLACLKGMSLPSVIGDTLLVKLFPHFYIPHYVWIDKEGIVRAMTSGDEFTRANVLHFLGSDAVPVTGKIDFDPNKILYSSDQLPVDKLLNYSIFLKGKIDGIGYGSKIHSIGSSQRGIVFNNRALIELYRRISEERLGADNRLLVSVKDTAGLSALYSYELVEQPDKFSDFFSDMLSDLNRWSPYQAAFISRKMPCWVLQRTGKADLFATKGGQYDNSVPGRLCNAPMLDLRSMLEELSGNAIVLDKTGYKGKIDITLTGKDMDAVSQQLAAYGLKLHYQKRKLVMLVIQDK